MGLSSWGRRSGRVGLARVSITCQEQLARPGHVHLILHRVFVAAMAVMPHNHHEVLLYFAMCFASTLAANFESAQSAHLLWFWLASQVIQGYPAAELVWCQEEPKNMGAWTYVKPRLETALRDLTDCAEAPELHYIGRPTAASPGEQLVPWPDLYIGIFSCRRHKVSLLQLWAELHA